MEEEFENIRLALFKSASSRSFDDLLSLRNFVFAKFEWIRKYFENTIRLRPIDEFCRSLSVETYDAGGIVFKQGDHPDKLYFVVHGACDLRVKYKVDLTKDAFEEREKLEQEAKAGCQFGEYPPDSVEPRTCTATATEPDTILITLNKYALKMVSKEKENRDVLIEDLRVSSIYC